MKKNYKLSAKQIRCYGAYLREQERADSTVQKYLHDLAALLAYLRGRALTKAVLLEKGLIGPDSAARRAALQQRLGLPSRLTANGLLEALDLLLTREEFDAL